jgi:myxalamid-type polyketide synthase MxaB
MTHDSIAVVGMAGRFPGAANIECLWELLASGRCAIESLGHAELLRNGVSPELLERPNYVRAAFAIDDFDAFDAELFGFSPREATLLDPQHRLFLETCLLALEDACIAPPPPQRDGLRIGVYAASGGVVTSYANASLAAWRRSRGQTASLQHLAADKDFIATRVSYKLNLTGPSLAVQTSTSSSLLAVHLACQALLNGEAEAALAGGACIRFPHRVGYLWEDGGVYSADGVCRPFDEAANGTVFGSGVGVVVLKRLADALAENDRIYAVIRGSAAGHDGGSKDSYTISSAEAVARIAQRALSNANVDARTIGLVEAHATGTMRGDPVEFAGLANAFRASTEDRRFCGIGSIKGNIGHLEAAAGIASFIKAVLAIQKGLKPSTLNVATPNSKLRVDESPFRILRTAEPWSAGGPARALVSSLGLGGTNVLVVLEQATESQRSPARERPWHLLCLSGATERALARQARQYAEFLRQGDVRLGDVAHSVNAGRAHREHRLSIAGETADAIAARLEAGPPWAGTTKPSGEPKVALLFSGQGGQRLGMARQLLECSPTFEQLMSRCDTHFRARTGRGLLDTIFGDDDGEFQRASILGPALFAVQHSLAMLLRGWGISPSVVMGHSAGEYAAAAIAGVLPFEDALDLISTRGRLVETLPRGGVVATVFSSAERVRKLVGDQSKLSIAAHNSDEEWVLSGPSTVLDEALAQLEAEGTRTRRIDYGYAGHSAGVDPILDELERAAGGIPFGRPTIPILSTVTGKLAEDRDLRSGTYWREHTRRMVRCAEALEGAYAMGVDVFVEIGPTASMIVPAMAVGAARGAKDCLWLPCLSRKRRDWEQLLDTVGALHARTVDVDWDAFNRDFGYRKVSVPGYPLERERFNLLEQVSAEPVDAPASGERALGTRIRSPALRDTVYQNEREPAGVELFRSAFADVGHFVRLALEVATDAGGSGLEIDDVTFVEPLPVGRTKPRSLQTIVRDQESGRSVFEVHSSLGNVDAWCLHCRGALSTRPGALDVHAAPHPLTVQLRCTSVTEGDAFYGKLEDAGVRVHEEQRCIRRICSGRDELVAEVALGSKSEPSPRRISRVVEAAAHALLALVERKSDHVWLPFGIDKLHVPLSLRDISGDTIHVTATIRERLGEHTVIADLRFDDASGPLAKMTGYCARCIDRDALFLRGRELSEWAYEVAWQQQDLPATTGRPTKRGAWVVVGQDHGLAKSLARNLREQGDTVELVERSELSSEGSLRPASPLKGVISLVSTTVEADAALADTLPLTCGSVLSLVSALARATPPSERPRLVLVTRGGQPVFGSLMNPNQASTSGLARTISAEYPELRCTAIDLDPHAADEGLAALTESVLHLDDELQVAYRANKRHVARLVRNAPSRRRLRIPGEAPFKLVLPSPGLVENLVLEPTVRIAPGPGQVEIATRAYGLSFRDVLTIVGAHHPSSIAIGTECAGVVTAIGEGVTTIGIGDQVFALAPDGAASHVVTDARFVVPKPTWMTFEQGAATPLAFVIAWHLLREVAKVGPQTSILIHSAAGAIGQAAIQLARAAGARVFATASPPRQEIVRRLGVSKVYSSRTFDFARELLADTDGAGVDVVLHSLQPRFLSSSASVLRTGGVLLDIAAGSKSDAAATITGGRGIRYEAFEAREWMLRDPEAVGATLREVLRAFGAGELTPLPYETYAVSDFPTAFRRLSSPRHNGKVVVSTVTPQLLTTAPVRMGTLDPFSAYLVVGGTPHEQAVVIDQLEERGARRVVVLEREREGGAAPPSTGDVIRLTADLTDAESIAGTVKRLGRGGPTIRGVFVLRDSVADTPLMSTHWSSFQTGFLQGASVAHAVDSAVRRLGLPLDFFVIFSSAASVLGSPGRALDAALSSYVDGLAHSRRALGLPATTVNWGAIDDAELPDSGHGVHWTRGGAGAVTARRAVALLLSMLDDPPAQSAIVGVRWAIAERQDASLRSQPFLTRVLSMEAQRKGEGDRHEALELLRAAPSERRAALLLDFVEGAVVKVLGLRISQRLDPRQGFLDLGLDSLLAVELRNILQDTFSIRLSQGLIFNYPNLELLAKYLLEHLFDEESRAPEQELAPASAEEDLSGLTSHDLEGLLEAELAELSEISSELE